MADTRVRSFPSSSRVTPPCPVAVQYARELLGQALVEVLVAQGTDVTTVYSAVAFADDVAVAVAVATTNGLLEAST